MKPLKSLKAQKLTLVKETLRTLTESDLQRVNGGGGLRIGSAWCSTATAGGKCQATTVV
jgi:hypothetical protein